MSPLAMLRRRAELENLAGDFEVHWVGPKYLLGDVLCGQGEATPELENHRHHFSLFPPGIPACRLLTPPRSLLKISPFIEDKNLRPTAKLQDCFTGLPHVFHTASPALHILPRSRSLFPLNTHPAFLKTLVFLMKKEKTSV